jgi:C_GCAxxG_C_C family probable redox protein
MTARQEKALALFKTGLACSQAVAGAYSDCFGVPQEEALRAMAAFGGGFARLRSICGCVSGMGYLAGLKYGGADQASKAKTYAVAQQMAEAFRAKNGSIVCGELLGLRPHESTGGAPSARTPEYYKKRPCADYVVDAAGIVESVLGIAPATR